MGAFVADGYVPHVQEQLNSRFAVGDALTEMIGFQKEFKLFSSPHTLRSAFTLLNIAPVGEKDREGFLRYLQALMKTKADVNGKPSNLSGHPAMSVPFGVGDDGLPVGVQVLAPALQEGLMLRVAAALESAAP